MRVTCCVTYTFRKAPCPTFRKRPEKFNRSGGPNPMLNPTYLATLRGICPDNGGFGLANLDPTDSTHYRHAINNNNFSNLQSHQGLLYFDQAIPLNVVSWRRTQWMLLGPGKDGVILSCAFVVSLFVIKKYK